MGCSVLCQSKKKMELLSKRSSVCKRRKDKEVDIEEKSCDDEFHGGCKERYLCCLKPKDSDPCVSKYECCEAPPNSEGCATVWKCCEEMEDAKGCKERYKCCLMPEDARGCEDKWECCDQAPEEKGCQTVCNRCGVRWGHKPGCSWPELDEETKEDQETEDAMKTNDYDEAHNPVVVHEDDDKIQIMDTMDAIEEDKEKAQTPDKNAERRQMSESVHMSTDELL